MAQIDIDIIDVLDECCSREIDDTIEWLDNNHHKKMVEYMKDTDNCITLPEEHSIQDEIWNEEILKLLKNRMALTYEDEQTILKIAKKFI